MKRSTRTHRQQHHHHHRFVGRPCRFHLVYAHNTFFLLLLLMLFVCCYVQAFCNAASISSISEEYEKWQAKLAARRTAKRYADRFKDFYVVASPGNEYKKESDRQYHQIERALQAMHGEVGTQESDGNNKAVKLSDTKNKQESKESDRSASVSPLLSDDSDSSNFGSVEDIMASIGIYNHKLTTYEIIWGKPGSPVMIDAFSPSPAEVNKSPPVKNVAGSPSPPELSPQQPLTLSMITPEQFSPPTLLKEFPGYVKPLMSPPWGEMVSPANILPKEVRLKRKMSSSATATHHITPGDAKEKVKATYSSSKSALPSLEAAELLAFLEMDVGGGDKSPNAPGTKRKYIDEFDLTLMDTPSNNASVNDSRQKVEKVELYPQLKSQLLKPKKRQDATLVRLAPLGDGQLPSSANEPWLPSFQSFTNTPVTAPSSSTFREVVEVDGSRRYVIDGDNPFKDPSPKKGKRSPKISKREAPFDKNLQAPLMDRLMAAHQQQYNKQQQQQPYSSADQFGETPVPSPVSVTSTQNHSQPKNVPLSMTQMGSSSLNQILAQSGQGQSSVQHVSATSRTRRRMPPVSRQTPNANLYSQNVLATSETGFNKLFQQKMNPTTPVQQSNNLMMQQNLPTTTMTSGTRATNLFQQQSVPSTSMSRGGSVLPPRALPPTSRPNQIASFLHAINEGTPPRKISTLSQTPTFKAPLPMSSSYSRQRSQEGQLILPQIPPSSMTSQAQQSRMAAYHYNRQLYFAQRQMPQARLSAYPIASASPLLPFNPANQNSTTASTFAGPDHYRGRVPQMQLNGSQLSLQYPYNQSPHLGSQFVTPEIRHGFPPASPVSHQYHPESPSPQPYVPPSSPLNGTHTPETGHQVFLGQNFQQPAQSPHPHVNYPSRATPPNYYGNHAVQSHEFFHYPGTVQPSVHGRSDTPYPHSETPQQYQSSIYPKRYTPFTEYSMSQTPQYDHQPKALGYPLPQSSPHTTQQGPTMTPLVGLSNQHPSSVGQAASPYPNQQSFHSSIRQRQQSRRPASAMAMYPTIPASSAPPLQQQVRNNDHETNASLHPTVVRHPQLNSVRDQMYQGQQHYHYQANIAGYDPNQSNLLTRQGPIHPPDRGGQSAHPYSNTEGYIAGTTAGGRVRSHSSLGNPTHQQQAQQDQQQTHSFGYSNYYQQSPASIRGGEGINQFYHQDGSFQNVGGTQSGESSTQIWESNTTSATSQYYYHQAQSPAPNASRHHQVYGSENPRQVYTTYPNSPARPQSALPTTGHHSGAAAATEYYYTAGADTISRARPGQTRPESVGLQPATSRDDGSLKKPRGSRTKNPGRIAAGTSVGGLAVPNLDREQTSQPQQSIRFSGGQVLSINHRQREGGSERLPETRDTGSTFDIGGSRNQSGWGTERFSDNYGRGGGREDAKAPNAHASAATTQYMEAAAASSAHTSGGGRATPAQASPNAHPLTGQQLPQHGRAVSFYSQSQVVSYHHRVLSHSTTTENSQFENDSHILPRYIQRTEQELRNRKEPDTHQQYGSETPTSSSGNVQGSSSLYPAARAPTFQQGNSGTAQFSVSTPHSANAPTNWNSTTEYYVQPTAHSSPSSNDRGIHSISSSSSMVQAPPNAETVHVNHTPNGLQLNADNNQFSSVQGSRASSQAPSPASPSIPASNVHSHGTYSGSPQYKTAGKVPKQKWNSRLHPD